MSKRNANSGHDAPPHADDNLTIERLQRHLQFLGLTHTLSALSELLAWATHERPGPTALLEHVLADEVAHKLDQRGLHRLAAHRIAARESGK